MAVEEAVRRVDDLIARENLHMDGLKPYSLLYRSGSISVDVGGVERGVEPCPHCGAMAGMGTIVVRHDDGRAVHFDPRLFHYARAGHPIEADDVDGDTLVAMMSDA